MVFQTPLKKELVNSFEENQMDLVQTCQLFQILIKSVNTKKWICQVSIIKKGNIDDKNYNSFISITIQNENGEPIVEKDEPGCILMLCDPICYKRFGKIFGVNLLNDQEFMEDLKSIIKAVQDY